MGITIQVSGRDKRADLAPLKCPVNDRPLEGGKFTPPPSALAPSLSIKLLGTECSMSFYKKAGYPFKYFLLDLVGAAFCLVGAIELAGDKVVISFLANISHSGWYLTLGGLALLAPGMIFNIKQRRSRGSAHDERSNLSNKSYSPKSQRGFDGAVGYPWPKKLVFVSYCYATVWFLAALTAVAIIAAVVIYSEMLLDVFLYCVGLFAATGWFTMLMAIITRCPTCNRRVFIDTGSAKHPNARNVKKLGHFSTIVIDVIRRREFVCMHCGTSYHVE